MTVSDTPLFLIHGAWHAAACFDPIRPQLDASGRHVYALDLPGHGTRRDEAVGDDPLMAYRQAVETALADMDRPTLLVAHSMGGVVAQMIASHRPELVAGIIYLCAYAMVDGENMTDWARPDTETDAPKAFQFDRESGIMTLDADLAWPIFHTDVPEEQRAAVAAMLGPEPAATFQTRVSLDADVLASIPQAYVLCTRDRTIGPKIQRRLADRLGCPVFEIPSGHSPFASHPDLLLETLAKAEAALAGTAEDVDQATG